MNKSKVYCDVCGHKPAVLIDHFEKHLTFPRKINICLGCHLAVHKPPFSKPADFLKRF